tara:strand:- start:140 stop:721 length:582 start_codon:yes stop_codon:yes gene_type:complete
MNININSPLLWKISAIIFISMLITCSGGCKSGKKLNSGSSGAVRIIGPSDLIQQPDGTFKLGPQNVKTKKIEIAPAKREPELPDPISAQPTPIKPQVKTQGLDRLSMEPAKLPPPRVVNTPSNLEEPPIKVNVNVRPNHSTPIDGDGAPAGGEEKPVIKIDWVSLLFFYFLASLFALGVWSLYDWYKSKNPKK